MKGFKKKDPQQNKKKIINAIPNEKKLISDALSFHSKGQLKDASNIYIFLIKSGCKDLRVYINLGVIYQKSRKFKEAKSIYLNVIKNFPNSPEAYSNLGKIFQDESEFKKAEEYYKRQLI